MKKIFLLLTALTLLGLSCKFKNTQSLSLPATPPENAFTEDKMADDDMMAQDKMMGDDQSMEQTQEFVMEKDDAGMMEEKSGAEPAQDDKMMEGSDSDTGAVPYYITYSSAELNRALSAKKVVLLYFWAGWCPICQADEPKVKAAVESSGLDLAGFRVNYDTEAALKAKYNIPHQHTTIILNTQGEESARFTGPVSEATLLAALRTAGQN